MSHLSSLVLLLPVVCSLSSLPTVLCDIFPGIILGAIGVLYDMGQRAGGGHYEALLFAEEYVEKKVRSTLRVFDN